MKIQDLDIVSTSEAGFDVEYEDVTIKVAGPYSRQAMTADVSYYRKLDQIRNASEIDDESYGDKAIDFAIHRAASRIISWQGIEEECTKENAFLLCSINPDIRMKILTESDKVENFLMSK